MAHVRKNNDQITIICPTFKLQIDIDATPEQLDQLYWSIDDYLHMADVETEAEADNMLRLLCEVGT